MGKAYKRTRWLLVAMLIVSVVLNDGIINELQVQLALLLGLTWFIPFAWKKFKASVKAAFGRGGGGASHAH